MHKPGFRRMVRSLGNYRDVGVGAVPARKNRCYPGWPRHDAWYIAAAYRNLDLMAGKETPV